MTVTVLLALIVSGLAFARMRRKRMAGALLVTALLLVFMTGSGLIPRLLLAPLQNGWQVQFSDWGQRNVIVLLGSGASVTDKGHIEPGSFAYGRIVRTVELYRACKAGGAVCRIEISGGDAAHLGTPLARVYAHELQRLGIPSGDMLLETRSMNTRQNAQFSVPLLHAFDPDRIVLVTSAMHMPRARRSFEHYGLKVHPVRAGYLRVPRVYLPKAWNLALTDLALHEYLGMAYYRLRWALQ